MARDVESEIWFLAKAKLYDDVKPYSLRFTPPDDSCPRHNLQTEKKNVTIHDARSFHPTLEENGFALTSFSTRMNYADFDEHEKIESVYAPDLQAHLKSLLQAQHVRVIDYAVRRRHPDFPISNGEDYKFQQPAFLAHIDFAYDEAISMLETLYGERAGDIMQYRWQIINIWRPLKGPLFDWPLAVCDSRTFDINRDAQVADAVYPEWAYENALVHHHPDQKWFYFSGMNESESLLFKCTDSLETETGPCPHAAFPIPQSIGSEIPRESIESRAFVLWVPIENLPKEVGTIYGKRN